MPLTVRVGVQEATRCHVSSHASATQLHPTSGSSTHPRPGTWHLLCGCGLRMNSSVLGFDMLPPPHPTMGGVAMYPALLSGP